MGRLWVGVLPNADSNLIGLSKFARLADWIMSRPQIQEEAVKTFADYLEQRLARTAWPSSWKASISACRGAVSRTMVRA